VALVSHQSIVEGLRRLGLSGQPVAVHSSLRSFGEVEGGALSVVEAVEEVCPTVLMPGFQCAAKVLPAPEKRCCQNGCDYAAHFDPLTPPKPFDARNVPLHPKMGRVSERFARQPGVSRSDHPWHSWLGWGHSASEWLADHPWEITNRPLEALAQAAGYVVLLGVGLTSCTAVHLGEERAGRRPFVRWAMDSKGAIREVATCGCAKGFGALEPYVAGLFRSEMIGDCRAQAARIDSLIEQLAPIIRSRPELTRCSANCLRCRDSMLGGPLLPDSPPP